MKRKKRRGSYLKDDDVAVGGRDDAYYLAESWFKNTGQFVGEKIGLTDKQIKRRNTLLKTLKALESKAHATHSPLQRRIRLLKKFNKPVLDTKVSRIKKVAGRFPKIK